MLRAATIVWLIAFATAAAAEPSSPVLTNALKSKIKLAAKPKTQFQCAGKPTLGKLLQSVIDEHKQWPVRASCTGDEAPFQCSVYVGTPSENADPSDLAYTPTEFSLTFFAAKQDGSGMRSDFIECSWH